jgi:hypothetical protein
MANSLAAASKLWREMSNGGNIRRKTA